MNGSAVTPSASNRLCLSFSAVGKSIPGIRYEYGIQLTEKKCCPTSRSIFHFTPNKTNPATK